MRELTSSEKRRRRRLLTAHAVSLSVLIIALGIWVFSEIHPSKRAWGRPSPMAVDPHELNFGYGFLSYRSADDWSTLPSAPRWYGETIYDLRIRLGVAELYWQHEVWYRGDNPQWALPISQRGGLPHDFYYRSGWDVSFERLVFFLCVWVSIFSAVTWKTLIRRHVPDTCRKCGYDLRATPNVCPECGATPIETR